jgi:hypothetical protein
MGAQRVAVGVDQENAVRPQAGPREARVLILGRKPIFSVENDVDLIMEQVATSSAAF